jgi:formate dehydrogenase
MDRKMGLLYSFATMSKETQTTFCRICEAACGLLVTTSNGKIVDVRPDPNHVTTHGFSCVKGLHQHQMYSVADRLKTPLKKVDGKHIPISWDAALAEIGEKVRGLRENEGPDAIGMYVGTAAGFSILHTAFASGFMEGLGSKSLYCPSSQDCSNKFAVSRHLYGFPFSAPFPDLERTQCLIIVGANPLISKWSFLQVPDSKKILRAIEARGGRVFVVDPRRNETAKAAGEHLFIRPGTDVFFYLSFLHELARIKGIDNEKVDRHMTGLEPVLALAAKWPAEHTETVTGIRATKLAELVRIYCESDGAAMYCSTGVNMGGNGLLAYWIQEVINAASGNLDRFGGTLVGQGIVDFIGFAAKRGLLLREDRSRIGNFPSVNDSYSGGVLADEILTPGEGQLKALFVTGGNPLITMANSERLRDAFKTLELLVCLDILPNETCREADYVLPCTDPFQRPDLPFIFPLMLGLQNKPFLQATQAVSQREGEQRDEPSIYLDLSKACGTSLFNSKAAQLFLSGTASWHTLIRKKPLREIPHQFLLNTMLVATKQKSFKKLLKHPHGLLRPDHQEHSFLGSRVVTEDGKVQLAPKLLMEQSEKLEEDFESAKKNRHTLLLISRRAVTTHNSWTHNLERMTRNGRHTNYLYMHPRDAEAAQLRENDLADVRSATNTVRIPVVLLDDLMPGTVALPHGWGHQHAGGLSVASKTTGVNVNLLTADGPKNLENISGMTHLTGVPVVVEPANGKQAHTWSGIEK